VIVEVLTQTSTLLHQRYTPQIGELTLESLGLPPTSQNAPFSMVISTMLNTQHASVPSNYRTLSDTIGFDWLLVDLIQFRGLDLNLVPNTLPHSISSPNNPTPSRFLRTDGFNQHGTSEVPTLSSNVRNRIVSQVSQPLINPATPHSPIQHSVNTIGTQHSSPSRVVIPQPRAMVHQPIVIVHQSTMIVP